MKELEKYLGESMFDDNFGVDDESVMALVNMFHGAECTYNGDMAWRFKTRWNGNFNWLAEWMDSSVAKHYKIKLLGKKYMLAFGTFYNGKFYPGIELKKFYCIISQTEANGTEFSLFYPVRVSLETLYYIQIDSNTFRFRRKSQNTPDIDVYMRSRNVVEHGGMGNGQSFLYEVPKKYLKAIINELKITQLNKYL